VLKLFRAGAILIALAIGIGSLTPVRENPLQSFEWSDKMIHVIAYSILGMSWLLSRWKHKGRELGPAVILFLVFFYGIVIEAFQQIGTSHRQADWMDLLANLAGVLLAWSIYRSFFTVKNVN
jgi:VanZ family protein